MSGRITLPNALRVIGVALILCGAAVLLLKWRGDASIPLGAATVPMVVGLPQIVYAKILEKQQK
jgi:hypothetical protein